MAYVHHPDGATVVEHVGSRTIEFDEGVARVDLPHLLAAYRKAGYVVTEDAPQVAPAPPARNASADAWRAYARTVATDPQHLEDIEAMTRDQLRDAYGEVAGGRLDD